MKSRIIFHKTGWLVLAGCALCAAVYADREFTATGKDHIPTAIQQIAQASAKTLSSSEETAPPNDSTDGGFGGPTTLAAPTSPAPNAQSEKNFDPGIVSEAFGHLIVKNLESPGFKFDINRVIKGMKDEMDHKPSPLTDEEYEQAVMTIQEKIFSDLATKNLEAANAFLEKNATAPGVVVLVPGKLQYKIVEKGTGAAVEPHSTPLIHYTGRYLDGTVFGSSKELGEPISLPLDQTIPGFSKGLLGMKEGEKRMLYIHPDLGYGVVGQLPPNSLLIFEVDLLKADTNKEQQPAPATPEAKPKTAKTPSNQ